MEFSDELLDRTAKALYEHDLCNQVPVPWSDVDPSSRKNYIGFAQVALDAALDVAGTEERFVVCGTMPIEGHPDYTFCSDALSSIEQAGDLLRVWTEEYGGEDGASYTIEHRVNVLANTHRAERLAERLADCVQAS
jgi:hypothetical protein